MQTIRPSETCYFTILHVDKFTPDQIVLIKNGEVITTLSVLVNISAVNTYATPGVFTFSFTNNGVDKDIFELRIKDTSTGERYTASWLIDPGVNTLAKQIQYIRSRLDSDGGFIGRDINKAIN